MKAEFDTIAENYSELMKQGMVLKGAGNDHAYFTAYKMYYLRDFIKKCRQKNSPKIVKILDYGCGIGIVSRAIADTFPNVIVHGFDISAESIKCADGIRHGKNIFFTSDLHKLDKNYDLCLCCCVLHYVPEEGRNVVVRNIYKRLKKDGILMVIEHNMKNPLTRKSVDACPFDRHAVMLAPKEVICLMENASFVHTRKKYITFFPKQLASLRIFEKWLRWCPFGAQHMETGRK